MPDGLDLVAPGIVMGVAGSALMDVWSAALRRFGIPTLDYRLLGRWIGHFPRGRFLHERIAEADPVRGEGALGWFAHYAIGVTFGPVPGHHPYNGRPLLDSPRAGRSWRVPVAVPCSPASFTLGRRLYLGSNTLLRRCQQRELGGSVPKGVEVGAIELEKLGGWHIQPPGHLLLYPNARRRQHDQLDSTVAIVRTTLGQSLPFEPIDDPGCCRGVTPPLAGE
jgi:hypothetical protein